MMNKKNMKKIAAAALTAIGYRENPFRRFCLKSAPKAKKLMASLLVAMSVSGAVSPAVFSAPQAAEESMAKGRASESSSAAVNKYTKFHAEIDAAIRKALEKLHKAIHENSAAKKRDWPGRLGTASDIFRALRRRKSRRSDSCHPGTCGQPKGESKKVSSKASSIGV